MNAPRVLVVGPRLDLGGAEIHLSRVLPRLREAGMDVSLFTIERGGSIETTFEAAGVPVFGIKVQGRRLARDLRIAAHLRSTLTRLRPDVVHFFLTEPYLVGSLAAAGLSGLTRVMSRRSLGLYQKSYPLVGRIERTLHRTTAALIGNSSAVCRELVQESGAPQKVGLIHNGIEIEPFPSSERQIAARAKLNIPESAFVIAVVANLIPYKGHADLVAALATLSERLGSEWLVLLAGRDQGAGPALHHQAEASGIAAHMRWLGECTDVRGVLAAADIGVLPSHEEGFSNSLIEKMAHGLAVVATDVGGNTDAIEDRVSGLLVPARDPAGLAGALWELYADPDLRDRLGRAARARVERMFSLEACVRRYRNLYRGLLSSNAPVAELIDPSEDAIASGLRPHCVG